MTMLVSSQDWFHNIWRERCCRLCTHRCQEDTFLLGTAQEDGKDKMSFVVTPLNLLGKQNVNVLEEAGLSAAAVSKETTSKDIQG